jgi:hypothetical protein
MTEKIILDDSPGPKIIGVRNVQDSERGVLVPDELPEGGYRAWSCVAGACVPFSAVSIRFLASSLALAIGFASKWLASGTSHFTRSIL